MTLEIDKDTEEGKMRVSIGVCIEGTSFVIQNKLPGFFRVGGHGISWAQQVSHEILDKMWPAFLAEIQKHDGGKA